MSLSDGSRGGRREDFVLLLPGMMCLLFGGGRMHRTDVEMRGADCWIDMETKDTSCALIVQ
jgi:hypothetical protein